MLDPRAELDELYKDIEQDPKFDYLRKPWVEFVPGRGPIDAKLMIVGEAPGRLENAMKTPFVGDAGVNLVNLLEDVDIKPHECFLTNAVKYWPHEILKDGSKKTRNPNKDEAAQFKNYLQDEIDIVNPKIIALAGVVPAGVFFPELEKPMYKNGELLNSRFVIVYHPAVVGYQPYMKSRVKLGYARLKNHLDNVGR